jgi:ferredoxin
MYRNVLVYYFSGTGNALSAARWIEAAARARSLNAIIEPIDRVDRPRPPALEGRTLLGFVYATHGFNAPWSMLKFIWRFPKLKEADVFLVNARGGHLIFNRHTPGHSGVAQLLPRILRGLKGNTVVGQLPLDPPGNWHLLYPAHGPKKTQELMDRCRPVVERFFDRLCQGKRSLRPVWELPIALAWVPLVAVYMVFARFLLAKGFMATSACTRCGLCVQKCPTRSLRLRDGRPYWAYTCESCMRCLSLCPKGAVTIAHCFIVPMMCFYFALYRPRVYGLFAAYQDRLPPMVVHLRVLIVQLFCFASFLVILWAAYALWHPLLRFRWINKLFAFTSFTTHWRKHRAPGVKATDFVIEGKE